MNDELKPCPGCGKTPLHLCITDNGQGAKWAECSCEFCAEWSVEFRTAYNSHGSEECMHLAANAWNAAPRAQYDLYLHAAAEQGKLIKELRGLVADWKKVAKENLATIHAMEAEIEKERNK